MQQKSPKKIILTILFTASILLVIYFIRKNQVQHPRYHYHEGVVFGTIYHIIYESDKDFILEIDSVLNDFDASLSSYNKNSIISKVNRNEPVILDHYFTFLFKKAIECSKKTGGAFDITVTPLIDAWGFGSGKKLNEVTAKMVDSLLQYVGMDKVVLKDGKIIKENPEITLNVNAIAKGYGTDVVADYLENKGLKNYLIEIGGEIRTLGKNEKGNVWTTAVNKPIDDNKNINMELENEVILMPNGAMATSGNYRNFYIENGKKYAHTINPITGYPVEHKLLSATVCMPTCLEADAFATAFMVLGLEKGKILAEEQNIPVYFIYKENDKQIIYISESFKKKIKQ